MGKKRKHQNGDDSEDLDNKRVKNEEIKINGLSLEDTGRYQVFLVKKPISVGLKDLEAIKWTGDEQIVSKTKLKTDSGNYRILTSSKAKKERMVHIPSIREREDEDAKNITASAFIAGSIEILAPEVKKKTLGGMIYEEGEEPDKATAEIHPGLKKIKKTAVLELGGRKQRNKAYGTTTDSDGKPRKLINILKN